MKQFSEVFLQLYFNKATLADREKHTALLQTDKNYKKVWADFCSEINKPQIAKATMPALKVEQVLDTLKLSKIDA